jgi:hypothetical protein
MALVRASYRPQRGEGLVDWVDPPTNSGKDSEPKTAVGICTNNYKKRERILPQKGQDSITPGKAPDF